jgi:hypothetical protein
MARLDRAIAPLIVLLLMARSGRAMTVSSSPDTNMEKDHG